jgi:2-polyprenyl-6-methoxyphenol hydroxylase-like FAD-dependent oxidoreductase
VHHKVGADTLTSQEPETGQALICGGGPCGLVAAITLHQLGWQDIVLVERRPSHAAFERGKAFNYQIDGRGQRALASIGLGVDSMQQYGVANREFTAINIGPDGAEKTYTFPLVRRNKQTAYFQNTSAETQMARCLWWLKKPLTSLRGKVYEAIGLHQRRGAGRTGCSAAV